MADFTFSIDGVDIRPYIAEKGIQWSRNDIDGENAGRTLSGVMVRDRVATKMRLDVSCRPLLREEALMIQGLIAPEFVSVHYTDLLYGDVSKVFYSNNGSAVIASAYDDTELIEDITFPLVEK